MQLLPAETTKLSMLLLTCVLEVSAIPFLPEDYNKYMYPPNLNGKPVIFSVNLRSFVIDSVNIMEGAIKIGVNFLFNWVDMRFNMTKDGKENFRFPVIPDMRHYYWKPDFFAYEMKMFSPLGGDSESIIMFFYGYKKVGYIIRGFLIVNCQFDFSMYPIDIQVCPINFAVSKNKIFHVYPNALSLKLQVAPISFIAEGPSVEEMVLVWNQKNKVSHKEYQLPLYHVKMCANPQSMVKTLAGGMKNVSILRFHIVTSRLLKRHIFQTYIPSTIFVIMSWGSFLVPPHVIPGRMILLVTTLLSIITLFAGSRGEIPPATEINCIEAWLLFCILFVFSALLQYVLILYLGSKATLKPKKLKDFMFNGRLYQRTGTANTKMHGKTNTKAKLILWKKFQTLKKLCQNPDSEKWGIQDRISICMFPIVFAICTAFYSYIVSAKLQTKSKSSLDEVEKCFEAYLK